MTESMGESEAKVRPIHPVCYIYHNLQLTQDVNILVFSLPAEETLAQSYLLMAVASPKSRMKPWQLSSTPPRSFMIMKGHGSFAYLRR